MAGPIYGERVTETSTTTGTGAYALGGAVTGSQTFAAVPGMVDGVTVPYTAWAVDGNGDPSGGWESGVGTFNATGPTLSRTKILASSNSGQAVSWGAGTKRISLALSAAAFVDQSLPEVRTLAALSSRPTKTDTQPNGDYWVPFPTAGNTVTLANRPAGEAGIITSVQMSMDGGAASFDCRLRVYVDQELTPSIDVDLGTLFCSHLDAHTGAGQSVGTDHIQLGLVGTNTHVGFSTANSMVSYQMQFPMPYSNGIKIEIYTPTGVSITSSNNLFSMVHRREGVRSSWRLRSRGQSRVDANAGSAYLAANDIPFFDVANNAGVMVWWSMACFGATNYTYLERPYRYFIDGESTESFINTGGEEYGATGWYFGAATRYAQPAVLLTATNNASFTTIVGFDLLRMHGGVRFTNRLKMVWGNKSVHAASTNHKMSWAALYYVDSAQPFVPTAPQSLAVTAQAGQLTFTWAAPLSQGSQPITGYTITLNNGGGSYTVAGNVLTKVVTGLSNGTTYTATVVATNAVGNSTASGSAGGTPTAPTVPGAPTGATAVAGNAQATINFTAPASDGGSTITGYTATSSPGGFTGSISGASAGPITVTGLTNGVSYTFTVHATNAVGNSSESSASNSVTPSSTTVPGAPTSVSASAGNAQATITFTAPGSNGGSAITGYTATSTPGGFTGSISGATAAPITVTGLTNGVSYTFTVHATNAIGNSAESAASNSVTPAAGTVADNFNRADSSSLGTTSSGSATWNVAVTAGTPASGISGNQAFGNTGTTNGNLYAYVDSGSATIDVSIKIATIGATPVFSGLIARYVDIDNLILLQLEAASGAPASYGCYKKVGGSYTNLFSSSGITPAAGDVLRLVVNGSTVTGYVNGTQIGTVSGVTGISTTSHNVGFQTGSTGGNTSTVRFDDLVCA